MLERFVSRTEFSSYEDFRSGCRITIPPDFNFAYDVVDEFARTDPDKRALVWCNDAGDRAEFSFEDVAHYSNRIANFLTSIGIGKGDAVMLVLKRRWEYWMTLMALSRIGAVAIPSTYLLTAQDMVYRNNRADIKMVIACDDERVLSAIDDAQKQSPSLRHKAVIRTSRPGWYCLNEEMEKASPEFRRPTGAARTENNDRMLIYFTSGTTGMPKMVLHDFAHPLGHILTAKYWQNVQDNGLHLTLADTGWAKSGWGKIYGQWIAGSAVLAYDYEGRFEPRNLLQVVQDYKVTTFCAPTTVYRFIAQEDISRYDMSHLKHCVTAGEPLYPEVYQGFLKSTGLRLMGGFGQSETVVVIGNYPWIDPRPGSMGKPSPGHDVDILNNDGEPCATGEAGQVVIRTDHGKPAGMFCGYYRDPDLSRTMWHDGVYYTGDIAWRDEDGYYWYVSRNDDMIKSSGYRIGPFEVESVLMEHPAVLECAVTGVPDKLRGQIVKATVVLSEGYEPSNELVKQIQAHVKAVTAPYKYPRIIEFVDALPRTTSGKVRRAEIRTRDKRADYKPELKPG